MKSYAVLKGITYTKKEIKSLAQYLNIVLEDGDILYRCQSDILDVLHLCKVYTYDFKKMRKNSMMLLDALCMPFEELPLHINDNFDDSENGVWLFELDSFFAMWRLKIGK